MKENGKKYNAIDFERYHSGNMPKDEMHALEKAALEDPFLADALDGYAYAKNAEEELDQIKTRLNEKRKQKNVLPFFSWSNNTWWKIAAMFIVIAGVGYFFFFLNSQKDHSAAVKEIAAKIESPTIGSPSKGDTAASEGNVAFEKTRKEKENTSRVTLPAHPVKSLAPGIKEAKQKAKRRRIEKSVAAQSAETLVMSTDKMKSEDIFSTKPAEKSFFRSDDTTTSVVVAPTVYSADTSNMLALNEKKDALNEVVVTGYGTKRKKNLTETRALQGKVSGVEINASSAYLKDGKKKFDQYITDNAVPPLDSNGNKIAADILLSFTLNKKCRPSHIKVLQSSCKPCEPEAIRLLKNGPVWVGKRGASGSVRIQF
jgi:hypothetical protein